DDPNLPPVLARPAGEKHVEVLVGGERAVEDNPRLETIKSRLARTGTLSFQILANERDHAAIIEKALKTKEREVRDEKQILARWIEVAADSEGKPKVESHGDTVSRQVEEDGKPKAAANGDEIHEFLVIEDAPEARVTGQYLVRASSTTDETGRPAISFTFNELGGAKFQLLTSRNRPREDGTTRQLGIILDGRLHSAPRLRAVVSTTGQITGRFTPQEADDLAAILNAGALPRLTLVETTLFEPVGSEPATE
ncbi:MAG: hypothetical protein WED34_09890, partial [Planctomycetales bacterium]